MYRKALLKSVLFLGCLLSLPIAQWSVARGEEPPQSATAHPHLAWVHEGMMVTSTWFAMFHSGHATDFKQDENGNWLAPDGTHLQASNRPGASAGGFTQAIVTCIDGDKVFLVSNGYTDMRLLGARDPVTLGKPRTFVVAMGLSDLWVDPDGLARARTDAATHTVVQPLKWKSGDRMVDAIRVTMVKPDHYIDHVFDDKTGLCLHAAESFTGAAPEMKYLAPGDTREGDTQLSVFDFVSLRDLHTPWAGEPLPAWTGQFKALHYRGQTRVMSGLVAPTPLGLDVSRLDAGNGWLTLSSNAFVIAQGRQLFPAKGIFLCGRDQFEGFFAGPASLAKLQPGQVLDTDPITHLQTSVAHVDGQSVTITSTNGASEVFHTFDRQTGKVTAFGVTDKWAKTQTSFQLDGED